MNPAAVLSILVRAQGIAAARAELRGLDGAVKKSSEGWKKNLSGATKAAGLAIISAGTAAAAAGGKMIDLASDAEETASKFKTVFAKETDKATKKLDDFSKATGTSKFALRDQAAQFQALVRPMGLSTKNAAGMSVGLTKMATDLASFNNTSVKDAIVALQSGLVGEAEPLRRYGVQLSATRVEAFAYANGIAKQGEKLTAAQKAQASYALILKDTALAQGDAVRTSGSFANQFKRLKDQTTDLATEFGVKLLPIATAVVGGITKFIGQMKEGEGIGGRFVAVIRDTVAWFVRWKDILVPAAIAIGAVAAAIGAVVVVQAAWNAIMAASPIGIVVIALVALAAGLIYAYQHSATFRDIVTAAFTTIKSIAVSVVSWLSTAIPAAFTTIKSVAGAVFSWLSAAFTTVVGAVKAAMSVIIGEVKQWDTLFSAIGRGFDLVQAAAVLFFAALKATFSAGMLVLGPILVGAWTLIKGIFSGAWAAIKGIVTGGFEVLRGIVLIIGGLFKGDFGQIWKGIKTIFSGGITALKGILEGAWKILKTPVDAIAAGIKDAFSNTWGRIKDVFRDSINEVIGFLNLLIKAINTIPGVPDIKPIGTIGGGGGGGRPAQENLGGSGHLARGGAFAKTGGLINHPMTFMGEEAPRHPEFVIPTNPAYRKRAQGLLGQAAGAIGLATGGVWGKSELAELWGKVNPGNGNPNLMAAIALAESGGRQGIVNSIGATGLWQIHPGGAQFLDPAANAREAGRKLTTQGLKAWEAYTNGSYQKFMGGDNGPMSSIGSALGAIGGVMGDLLSKGADFILNKLPGTGGLPDWLKGTGKYVLGKATSWIKDKVGGLLGGGGVSGAGVAGGQGFGDMLSAAQSIAARNYPYAYGGGHNASFSGPYDCSGLVSAILHAGGLLGSPMSTDGLKVFGEAGDGQLVTIGVRGSTGRNAHTMIKLGNRYIESGSGHGASWVSGWSGGFPIHRHPVGMAKGGVFDRSKIVMPPEGWGLARGGILGSYKDGTPYVPQTGAYLLHQGESVIPAEAFAAGGAYAKGTGVKLPSNSAKSQIQQAAKIKAAQAFVKAQKAQIAKGLRPGAAAAVVVVSGDVGGGVDDPNQALIDAINAKAEQDKILADEQKARDDELARLEQVRIDLTKSLLVDKTNALNVSQSQYGVLSQALWEAVSRSGGAMVGLSMSGLRSSPGSVSRA